MSITQQQRLAEAQIRQQEATQRAQIERQAREAQDRARREQSRLEKERQDLLEQSRKQEAQLRRAMNIPGQREKIQKQIKQTEAQRENIEKQAQEISKQLAKTREQISKAEKETTQELEAKVKEATEEVRATAKELREKYVELKNGELVDRKEFMSLPPETQKKLKELGTKGYESFVKVESAKAEKKFNDNNVKLDTGEWISKQYYNSLIPADRAQLKELGVEKYNEQKKQEAREQFHKRNIALGNGEWVSREFYNELNGEQKQELKKLGIEKFNEQQKQQAQDFNKNHIQLTTGEWVSKDYWNSLDGYQQADLMFMGVDDFTKAQKSNIQAFEANNIKINNGQWVNKEFYNSLNKEQQTVLNERGIEGFNEYYKVKQELFEHDNKQLETGEWVSNDYWESLKTIEGAQEALDTMGVEGFNKWAIDNVKTTTMLPAQLLSKAEALDLISTLPPEYKAGEGYDLAKYIRDNNYDPSKVQQLITKYGFDNEAVKQALTYANQDYYKPGSVEQFVNVLDSKGIDTNKLTKEEILMAAEYITTGDIKIKQDGSIASGAINRKQAEDIKSMLKGVEIEKDIAKQVTSEASKSADMPVDEFVANYLATRTIDPKDRDLYKSIAELEYKNLYGEKQYKESKFVSVGEIFIPALKALQPGKTKKDITGVDWAISAAQVALAVVAPALGAADKVAGVAGKAAQLGNKTVQLASAATFAGVSAAEWKDMDTTQKIVSTVINLAIIGAVLKPLTGAKLPKNISKKALTASDEWKRANAAIRELKSTPLTSAKYTAAASKAQKAIQSSRVADIKFIDELQRVTSIDAKQLKKLEEVTGIKGIKGAITDINAAKNKLSKVWDELDNYKWGSKEYIHTLPELTEAQANVVKALTNYQNKLKPRIKIPKSNKAIDIMDRNVSEAVMAAENARDAYSTAKSLSKTVLKGEVVPKGGTIRKLQKQARIAKLDIIYTDAQQAIKASQQADLKLIDKIQRLKTATADQIKRIEQTAGVKGLTKAIKDATKAKDELKEVWKKIDKTTFGSKEYIALLPELEKAKAALNASLGKYQSLLKTRISRYTLAFEGQITDMEQMIQRAEKGLKSLEQRLDDITMPSAKKEYYEEWYSLKSEIEELNTQLKALKTARETGVAPQGLRWTVETRTAGKPANNLDDLAKEIDDIFASIDKSMPDTPAKPVQAGGALQPELGISAPSKTKTATAKVPKVDIDIDIKPVAGSAFPEPSLSVPQIVAGQNAANYLSVSAPKIIPEIVRPLAGIKLGLDVKASQKTTAKPKVEIVVSTEQSDAIQSLNTAYQKAEDITSTAAEQITDTIIKPETGTRQQVVTGIEAAINEGIKAAEKVIQKANEKTIDETKLREAVVNAVDTAIKAEAKTLPATKTATSIKSDIATDVMVETAITLAVAATVVTATAKPFIPLIVKLPDDTEKELTEEELEGAIAWKQGFMYILIFPPYGEKNIAYSKKPFPGVRTVDGAQSAFITATRIGGKVPEKLARKLGFFDLKITTPKEGKPKLKYTRRIGKTEYEGEKTLNAAIKGAK